MGNKFPLFHFFIYFLKIMPSIVFMNASSNDEPVELDLTKATKKDVYDAFKKSCKQARKDQELKK
tara:strand:- start:256 stop:450 length:195 start_codon:yes stop_codon:yes gene_type:complete